MKIIIKIDSDNIAIHINNDDDMYIKGKDELFYLYQGNW